MMGEHPKLGEQPTPKMGDRRTGGRSGRPTGFKGGSHFPTGLCVALGMGMTLAMGSLVYLSFLVSPDLLRSILRDSPGCGPNISGEFGQTGLLLTRNEPARPKLRILLGVLTTAANAEKRSFLRLAYAGQSSPHALVSVRFVMGRWPDSPVGGLDVERTLIGMENATFGDIIVLGCAENMNHGKTYSFFSSLPGLGLHFDYVMKTDDDSYIRVDNLAASLLPLPREDLYYGYILPCENQDAYQGYMAGMGYLISWDLVEWIRDSPVARNRSDGTEDKLVGEWFDAGGVAKHRVNRKPLFYDHLGFGGPCAHDLVPDTILVHQVKTRERWADVLSFFEKDRISGALSSHPSLSPSPG